MTSLCVFCSERHRPMNRGAVLGSRLSDEQVDLIDAALQAVGQRYSVCPYNLGGRSISETQRRARAVASWLCRELTEETWVEIGRHLSWSPNSARNGWVVVRNRLGDYRADLVALLSVIAEETARDPFWLVSSVYMTAKGDE